MASELRAAPKPSARGPVEVEVQGVIVERGRLFAFVSTGRRNFILSPSASVLVSFRQFQDFVFDKIHVEITHQSQNDWTAALKAAFRNREAAGRTAGSPEVACGWVSGLAEARFARAGDCHGCDGRLPHRIRHVRHVVR